MSIKPIAELFITLITSHPPCEHETCKSYVTYSHEFGIQKVSMFEQMTSHHSHNVCTVPILSIINCLIK